MSINQDYQEIAETLENYFDGFYEGNVGKLRKIFHPNCHLYSVATGSLADSDIETVYDRVFDRENPGDRNDQRFDQIVTIDKSLIFFNCCVPCQSISNKTSLPCERNSMTGFFKVP